MLKKILLSIIIVSFMNKPCISDSAPIPKVNFLDFVKSNMNQPQKIRESFTDSFSETDLKESFLLYCKTQSKEVILPNKSNEQTELISKIFYLLAKEEFIKTFNSIPFWIIKYFNTPLNDPNKNNYRLPLTILIPALHAVFNKKITLNTFNLLLFSVCVQYNNRYPFLYILFKNKIDKLEKLFELIEKLSNILESITKQKIVTLPKVVDIIKNQKDFATTPKELEPTILEEMIVTNLEKAFQECYNTPVSKITFLTISNIFQNFSEKEIFQMKQSFLDHIKKALGV